MGVRERFISSIEYLRKLGFFEELLETIEVMQDEDLSG